MNFYSLVVCLMLSDAICGQGENFQNEDVICSDYIVYIRLSTGLLQDSLSSALVVADGETCSHEESEDFTKLHGCKKDKYSPLVIYMFRGTDCVVMTVICFPDEMPPDQLKGLINGSVHQRLRRIVAADQRTEIIKEQWDLDVASSTKTSVVFSVKLKYSSNDDIFIACNPDDSNNLYLTNPKPDVYKSVLAFIEANFIQCPTQFYNDRNLVMISQCDLTRTIIVSFNKDIAHSPIIGGKSDLAIYRINCANISMDERAFDFINTEDHGQQTNVSMIIFLAGLVLAFITP